MIHSMTGYGVGKKQIGSYDVIVEIRSMNHRYFELKFKGEPLTIDVEQSIKTALRQKIFRGSLVVFIQFLKIETIKNDKNLISFNKERIKAYAKVFEQISEDLKISSPIPEHEFIFWLCKQPGILTEEADTQSLQMRQEFELPWGELQAPMNEALDSFMEFRKKEGSALEKVLLEYITFMKKGIFQIKEQVDNFSVQYQDDLQKKIEGILTKIKEKGEFFSQEKLFVELALLLAPNQVEEEIVRIEQHLIALEEMLVCGGEVGKKMEFLLQELQREFNTLGNKASQTEVNMQIIEMKTCLEKYREQVQNVE